MKALRWMVCYSLAGWFVNRKGIGARRGRWLERKGRLKAGDGLVKRRHIHVGAPDNRIGGLYLKSLSWRPGAKTWTRNLDSVVAASPERRLSYLSGWSNGIFVSEQENGLPILVSLESILARMFVVPLIRPRVTRSVSIYRLFHLCVLSGRQHNRNDRLLTRCNTYICCLMLIFSQIYTFFVPAMSYLHHNVTLFRVCKNW